jgi:hypothetical protein
MSSAPNVRPIAEPFNPGEVATYYKERAPGIIPFLEFASTSFIRLVTVLSTECAP